MLLSSALNLRSQAPKPQLWVYRRRAWGFVAAHRDLGAAAPGLGVEVLGLGFGVLRVSNAPIPAAWPLRHPMPLPEIVGPGGKIAIGLRL